VPYQIRCIDCELCDTVDLPTEALAIRASHAKSQPPVTREDRSWDHRVSVYRGIGPTEKDFGRKTLRRYPLEGSLYCILCNEKATWVLDQGWPQGYGSNYLCDHHADRKTHGNLHDFIFRGEPTDLSSEAQTLVESGIWAGPEELYERTSESFDPAHAFVVWCNICYWKKGTETEARASQLKDQHNRRSPIGNQSHFARIYRGQLPVTFAGEKYRSTRVPIDEWEDCQRCVSPKRRAAYWVEPNNLLPEAMVGGFFLCEHHTGGYEEARSRGCGASLICLTLMALLALLALAYLEAGLP